MPEPGAVATPTGRPMRLIPLSRFGRLPLFRGLEGVSGLRGRCGTLSEGFDTIFFRHRYCFAVVGALENHQNIPDPYGIAGLDRHGSDGSRKRGWNSGHGLVRLHFEQRIPFFDPVTDGNEDLDDLPFVNAFTQIRQSKRSGHENSSLIRLQKLAGRQKNAIRTWQIALLPGKERNDDVETGHSGHRHLQIIECLLHQAGNDLRTRPETSGAS